MPDNWEWHAACSGLDADLFFVGEGRAGYRKAKLVCARCPVAEICLWFAMSAETVDHRAGVFGGMTPDERTNLAQRYSISQGVARDYYEKEIEFWSSSRSTQVRQLAGLGLTDRPL